MVRVLLIALIIFTGSFGQVQAQESAGVGLTPSLIEEGVDPGDSLVETITVTNLSANTQTYFLFFRDIAGVEEGGRPIYADADQAISGQEVSAWVTLERTEVTLAPEESTNVSMVIDVPVDATPGSHFGGIFASLNPPADTTFGVGAAVGYQVGNIVSLRVSGDIFEEATVRSLQTDRFVYGEKNVLFTARIENKGNVLVRPVGPLEITNMLGDIVAAPLFNDSKNGIYPDSVRKLELRWQEDGLGFGRYEAMVSFIYGEPGEAQQTITANTSFWVLPWEIIRPLLITLAILGIISYILVRRYISIQVQRLSGSRRLVQKTNAPAGPSLTVLVSIVMLFVTAFVLLVALLLFA